MIYEWLPDDVPITDNPKFKQTALRNYGDALIDVLLSEEELDGFYQDDLNCYSVLGSTICNEVMDEILSEGLKPVFINCGWRGDELDSDLVNNSKFISVRGPRTKAVLKDYGVDVSVQPDPAYNLPELLPRGSLNAQILFIPHILDPYIEDYDPLDHGADIIVTPAVSTRDEVVELTKTISGARFVFTGSMHAAIVAHAYGVPFGLFSFGYVDCPPKWKDWGDSVYIEEIDFFDNVSRAREWHNIVVPPFQKV
jgi:hypothetical protein